MDHLNLHKYLPTSFNKLWMLQQHFSRKGHVKQEYQNNLKSCQICLLQFACVKTEKEKKKKTV